MVGMDVTSKTIVTPDHPVSLKDSDTVISNLIIKMSQCYMKGFNMSNNVENVDL